VNIVLIVGASGTGKDTLLRTAGHTFAERADVLFLQRYITRPSDANENNYFLDQSAFNVLQANNFFISHWQAHGNSYGIAENHIDQVPEDGQAVISVSRTAIADFESKYSRVFTIQIQADLETLQQRLRNRNREDSKAIEQRLARAGFTVPARHLILFDNSRDLRQTAPGFIQLLESLLTNSCKPQTGDL